jgi:FMN reductase
MAQPAETSDRGRPLIVGMGGTAQPSSSSECALRHALDRCRFHGAETLLFDGLSLDIPMYAPGAAGRTDKAAALIAGLRRADGVIISSPGYHGTLSGLIKNALDYVEDMARDERAYFEGRAVGLIAVAAGWQAAGTTLMTLRAVTHALRGWPTPMAVAINSREPVFDAERRIVDPGACEQLDILAHQVVTFAHMRAFHEVANAASQEARRQPEIGS